MKRGFQPEDLEYVKISVPRRLLDKINAQRIQYADHREPQHVCLERILKFYGEHNGTSCSDMVTRER